MSRHVKNSSKYTVLKTTEILPCVRVKNKEFKP